MKYTYITFFCTLFFIACKPSDKSADAFGNFEANDIVLSSQAQGNIIFISSDEGAKVSMGDTLAIVDTTDVVIRISEMNLQLKVTDTKIEKAYLSMSKTEDAIETAKNEQRRVHQLYKDDVVTDSQKDQIDLDVLLQQKSLRQQELEVKSLRQHKQTINNQIDLLLNQKRKCTITAPINATVLNRYKEVAEFVMNSTPIYKVASLNPLTLRVYISGDQLSEVTLGQTVSVAYDKGDVLKKVDGTISWISDKAEFTPKTIQTKAERVAQVYAVKIRVVNPAGEMKIGMPGELHIQ
ncbi:HlyD family efflux transporter periplasmic adaptor subunit [Halosquirtibacter xylanolyticus]|uniref:HlyD family secretion protein n=1 Tax=Halosquirtibacter xylanolyticus TaxID=3374599 RepID=UPI00374A432E|nr:HlyD family efflux transporter periplasmic adaptor subunit [Prolixibacteraceae bacterium]